MVLDAKIKQIREHFQIIKIDDWKNIFPSQVLSVPGIGDATLNHLRLHLAAHGVTLREDETPLFWQKHLRESFMGTVQVSEDDRHIVTPFTILVDKREQHPFTFQGILGDSKDGNRPMLVRTRLETLGDSHGDYSIDGLLGEVHYERKSMADAQQTILQTAWGEDRFRKTLEFLEGCRWSGVIVECTVAEMLGTLKQRGKTPVDQLKKTLNRSWLALTQDYRVNWYFFDTRRLAEVETFNLLRRAWQFVAMEMKEAEKAK